MKILFLTNSFRTTVNGPAKFANYLLEINQPCSAHEVRILTEDIEDGHDSHILSLEVLYEVE